MADEATTPTDAASEGFSEEEVIKLWNAAGDKPDQYRFLEVKYLEADTGLTKDYLALIDKDSGSTVVQVNGQTKQDALNILARNPGVSYIHPGVVPLEATAPAGAVEVPVTPDAPLPQLPEEPQPEEPAPDAVPTHSIPATDASANPDVTVNTPVEATPLPVQEAVGAGAPAEAAGGDALAGSEVVSTPQAGEAEEATETPNEETAQPSEVPPKPTTPAQTETPAEDASEPAAEA